ncbi:hypothetical protein ASZ90_000047 [hydrocarbon metagenome]|uniref:Uncharacterized protein n=1 Tax=hydrocarbon metagenome TaxID=938273 RepID=A0A0W8GAL9_9ZZZZ
MPHPGAMGRAAQAAQAARTAARVATCQSRRPALSDSLPRHCHGELPPVSPTAANPVRTPPCLKKTPISPYPWTA